MSFVHLHVHSQFSLLDGTMGPKQIAKSAAAMGHSAIAQTDTSNLFGAVAFYKACKGLDVKPIIGAELHVDPQGIENVPGEQVDSGYQIIALIENDQGYENLCALVTLAIFDGMQYKPRVDLKLLAEYREGLIFLTGGRKGCFGRAVLKGKPDRGREQFAALSAALGPDQLFIELQDHGLDGQQEVNELARSLSAEHRRATVVTNAVHYASAEDSAVHETLNAIALGCSLKDPRRMVAPTDQAWLKTEAEIRELFPNDELAVSRTNEIAKRCNYDLPLVVGSDGYHFPATTPPDVNDDGTQPDTEENWKYFYKAFPPPRDYEMADPDKGEMADFVPGAGSINGYIDWYSTRGLELRLEQQRIPADKHREYWDRLRVEIDIIVGMGFPAYLLIVAEFINWSKDNEIPVGPGRGSAAGSLVAYAMRITDIDPIRFDLLFERFLNPARVSMPDIDVDFCQDRREEAIAHVRDKYGTELVSQIITYGTLKAKAAVRDVARVLGLNFPEADRIAKLIPDALGTTLSDALDQVDMLRDLRDGDPKVRRVIDLAMRVEGMNRQTGVHAAGVVIGDQPLVKYAPLYREGPEGGPVVQYDMKSAEGIGLIKFDFLGLKTLDQIRDAIKAVQRNHGVLIDMSKIPFDDPKTFTLLQDGDALGIFQLESSGMRDLLTRLKPTVLDDIVALVALYRPGPLSSGMTDDFVDRKHGRKKVEYPLPMLEPILISTYGTIVYQEQVMQIAQVMAGYSLGEADLLRRAMGKKKKEEMDKQKARFVSGSIANGIDERKAVDIFELLAKFAAYGFNKSHSAAYGVISYQTAYLKANYRSEYMAALMTIEAGNTEKVLNYIQDCRRHGIVVKPVCVNESVYDFFVPPHDLEEDGFIRYGMAAVKGIGRGAIEAIIEARDRMGGRFDTPFEFFQEVDFSKVNRRVVEALVKSGAFDYSDVSRASLMHGLEAAMSSGQRAQEDKAAGQVGLFAMLAPASRPPDFRFTEVLEWSLIGRLAAEKEVLGLYLTGHPMQAYEWDVGKWADCHISELTERRQGSTVKILAVTTEVRATRTRRGDRMAIVQLEDATGGIEAVFFPEPWARSQAALKGDEPVLIEAKLAFGADGPELKGTTAQSLTDLRSTRISVVTISARIEDLKGRRAADLKAILEEQRGNCEAMIRLNVDDEYELMLGLPMKVDPGTATEEAVRTFLGRAGAVRLQ